MAGRKRIALCAAAGWLLLGIALTVHGARAVSASNCSAKLSAARLMQEWTEAVREMKLQAGLTRTEEDLLGTWLVGERYTRITTTLGDPAAKRTACDPNMAAVLVEMLERAGIRPGDTVGAGFSGSFPGINLAVLAACQVLDVKCVYIASVGASSYGANQPELTFPDMACRLYQAGLLERAPSLVTPGGDYDCGAEMDPELKGQILQRIAGYGVSVLEERDFQRNLSARADIYDREGPICCFIGVGGNISTLGLEEENLPCGLIPGGTVRRVTGGSGLLQRYNLQGLPVLHLLNIRRLAADYGLAFDAQRPLPLGEGAIYYETRYPKWGAVLCLTGAVAAIWFGFRGLRQEE